MPTVRAPPHIQRPPAGAPGGAGPVYSPGAGTPSTTPAPSTMPSAQGTTTTTTGGTGGGTTSGGGGVGGTAGGPGTSGIASAWGKLVMDFKTKPSWWHGLWPISAAAATVRDLEFAMLSDLDKWPYNANQFFIAYFYVMLQAQNQVAPVVPLPANIIVTVLDALGNTVGTSTVTFNEPSGTVTVPGTFTILQSYTVQLQYQPNGEDTGSAATLGPYAGTAIDSAANPQTLLVQVANFPSEATGMVTIQNADGSPATGKYVNVGIFIPASSGTPAQEIDQGIGGTLDVNGSLQFSSGLSMFSPSQTYQINVLVYNSRFGSMIGSFTQMVPGSALGSLDLTYNLANATPPPSSSLKTQPKPPPHTGKGS